MNASFDEIKSKVLGIINKNMHKEVSRKTDMRNSGIYMLYVDCFLDESIIPFYIGQTADFQKRHKQHLSELLSLNRLNQNHYKSALFKGLYNGHYRSCKIFSYMLNHNCNMNDFHMIVLEEIEDENERLKRENEYINDLSAPFLGFNQMNCISRYADYLYGSCSKSEFMEIVESDVENLICFSEYGYSLFNCYHSSGIFRESRKEQFVISRTSKQYTKVLEYSKRLPEVHQEIVAIRRYNLYECQDEAWEICKSSISEFFLQNGLKSKDKQKLVIKVLLFDFDDERKTLTKYFERYSKEPITSNILDILIQKHGDVIEPIKKKILSNQKKYRAFEEEVNKISENLFSLLLPLENYQSHPLKSMYEGYQFPCVENVNNICYINIEYTCFRNDYYNDFYPEICKIDYLIVRGDDTYSRTVFIKNSLEYFFERDDVYYSEKGFGSGPFNIRLVGSIYTHIPVTMEYKNGINEYTLRGVNMEDEIQVFKEIDALIDAKTKIIYTTSGYKSSIKSYSEIASNNNINVIKRLIRLCN